MVRIQPGHTWLYTRAPKGKGKSREKESGEKPIPGLFIAAAVNRGSGVRSRNGRYHPCLSL